MLCLHNPNPADALPASVGEVFPGLSTRWLPLDWSQLTTTERQLAARLVNRGAAQVRLRCTIRKEGVAPSLGVTIVALGDYWLALRDKLKSLAEAAVPWQHRPGKFAFETAKVGLRWTDTGQQAWQDGHVSHDDAGKVATGQAVPAQLEVEECRFVDGTPFPGGMSQQLESEAVVSWSLEESRDLPGALPIGSENQPLSRTPPPKRSWKQAELDAAIGEYRDDPAHEFLTLRDSVQSGSPQAYARAKEIFGRNAVVRHLGVRGAAMVSRSPVWQALAADLDLPRGKGKPLPLRSYGIIPLDQALAAQAAADGGTVLDEVVQTEARRQIDQIVHRAALRFRRAAEAEQFAKLIESVKVSLECGKVTPEQAPRLAELVIQQVLDGQTLRIRQRP